MTLVLNLLPIFIASVFLCWAYARHKKGKGFVAQIALMICSLFFYYQAQPSYMPKGVVARSSVPEFEDKKLEVKDNLKKPLEAEKRDEIIKEKYKERLPFLSEEK